MAAPKYSQTPKPTDNTDEPYAESPSKAILQLEKTVQSIEEKVFNSVQLETIHQYWADIHNFLSAELSRIPVAARNEHRRLESSIKNYLEYLEVYYEAMTEEMHRMISILKPKHQEPSNPPPVALHGTKELMDSLRLVIYHAQKATAKLNELIDETETEKEDYERLEKKEENTKPFMEATKKTLEVFKAAEADGV